MMPTAIAMIPVGKWKVEMRLRAGKGRRIV